MLSTLAMRRQVLTALDKPTLPKNIAILSRYAGANGSKALQSSDSLRVLRSSSMNNSSLMEQLGASFQGLMGSSSTESESTKITSTRRSIRLQNGNSEADLSEGTDDKDEQDNQISNEFYKIVGKYCIEMDSSHLEHIIGIQKSNRRAIKELEKYCLKLQDPVLSKDDISVQCKRRKTSLVEEHASENIPTSSIKRSDGSGNDVQLKSRSKRQSFGTDHLKNDRQVIEAEVLEIEELLDKSYEETSKKLAALRIIVEREGKRGLVSKQLEDADKDVMDIFVNRQLLKSSSDPIPEHKTAAALKTLETRNLILQQLDLLDS